MDMDITQIGIVVFGMPAITLLACKKEKVRRWGYIAGFLSQPFWFWSAIQNRQWGVLLLACWYTLSWARGIWNFWIINKN